MKVIGLRENYEIERKPRFDFFNLLNVAVLQVSRQYALGIKMKDIVRWGIVGAGGIARRRTIPAINEISNASIQAVMDTNTNGMIDLMKEYDIPDVYGNIDDMLRNADIDAVYIASPVLFHKEQAIKILEAGKHLLIEKPLGIHASAAKEIMECAKTKNVCAGVAMVMRFHDGHQKIKEMIGHKDLGEIVCCRGQLTCWFPPMEGNWRQNPAISGGGALMDMGIHCIDLIKYLMDDRAEKTVGIIENKSFSYPVEDSASFMLKMKKGATCYIDAYFNIPDQAAKCFLEIYGTKGSIIANGTIGQDGCGDIKVYIEQEDKVYESSQVRNKQAEAVTMEFEQVNMYAKQLSEFSECILTGKEPRTTMEDAYDTMKIIDAVYESAKKERVIYL